MLKLNLGCGSTKIPGYVNIDVEKKCKPDKVCNFLKEVLPFENESCDEILLFHTIEHIRRVSHGFVLANIHRVLKKNGTFYVSFPEFRKCYENWVTNKNGQKGFWEATMFGRQLYPSDYHVVPMDSAEFGSTLLQIGFKDLIIRPEPEPNEFNTVISCKKGKPYLSYEQLVSSEIKRTFVKSTR